MSGTERNETPAPEPSFGSGILGDSEAPPPGGASPAAKAPSQAPPSGGTTLPPPPPPPALPPTGIPDLTAWGTTSAAPPPVEHAFEPGDDIGNRSDSPLPATRRHDERYPRRRGPGGFRGPNGPPRGPGGPRREGSRRDPRDFPRRPHIPGPPPPPTDLPGNPRVLARPEHKLSRKNLDANALFVLNRIHRAGHKAYLVGGGVRDLLLGLQPKDFDVATDASPQQVKRLFPHAMVIGRRFKLCHVRFGTQVVEVATFRGKGAPVELAEDAPDHGQTPLDENVFGTPEEDALRRDITINGLFYDIGTFALIDYVGGLEDLERKVVRVIGSPAERFREDPVRMVRVARVAARLGFAIDPETRGAIEACRATLSAAHPARLLEEWYRLMNRGEAERSVALLRETGLLESTLPAVAAEWDRVRPWLAALDQLDASFRPLPNALCLAGLFGARVAGAGSVEDLSRALDEDFQRLTVSRRDRNILVRMVLSQHHFEGGRRPEVDSHFPSRDYFPAALDFFELRGRAAGAPPGTLVDWRRAESEVPRRPLGRAMEPLPGVQGVEGGGDMGDGGGRRRRRRRGSRGRQGASVPGQGRPARQAGAQGGRHDLEQGPPPEVIEKLYARDRDEEPGWQDDAQPGNLP